MPAKSPPKEPSGSQPDASQPPAFDQSLARLEKIVAELETGGLALEAAIERYQEGVTLLRACRGVLDGYKKRVEELAADGTLAPVADPDAEDADAQERE